MESLFAFKDIGSLGGSSFNSEGFIGMFLLSLLFGIMLNILYTLYYRDSEPMDGSLSRSLVLLTPSLMTIFWMVQYSLPLSVGLLGTLSFVRFRSPVKRAEDICFIIISLACSISCAILKPIIGAVLITIFLLYSLCRNYFFPMSIHGRNFAVLTFNTKKYSKVVDIETAFKEVKCRNYEFISSRTYDGLTSFVFNISGLNKVRLSEVIKKLESQDSESNINVFYPNGRLGA